MITNSTLKIRTGIPVDSCHHEPWLKSVPKSHYMHLKRNCTKNEKFLAQAAVLTERFKEKGYANDSLTSVLGAINNMNKEDLLKVKPPREFLGFCLSPPTLFNTRVSGT